MMTFVDVCAGFQSLVCECSGELLGGCDIIMELQQAGELKGSIDEMCART